MTTTEKLGRFGHHPNPADDFCIEVESLQSIVIDKGLGLRADENWPIARIERALTFTVGGDENAVAAKDLLRGVASKAYAGRAAEVPVADLATHNLISRVLRHMKDDLAFVVGTMPNEDQLTHFKLGTEIGEWLIRQADLANAYPARTKA